MSSTIHPAQAQQPSKQWWSRLPSKSSTIAHRNARASPSSIPQPTPKQHPPSLTLDNPRQMSRSATTSSKPTHKFNTFASAIGFKSKKTHHATLDIPPGPASPPLPFQSPPPPSIRAQKSSSSSLSFVPKSPVDSELFTSPSEEDGFEPVTPSDFSRHRVSYQPSLFTFAEQQQSPDSSYSHGESVGSRLGLGSSGSYRDSRTLSIMSDPSVIDPHLKAARSSRISASSYYPPPSELKVFPVKGSMIPTSPVAVDRRRRKSSVGYGFTFELLSGVGRR